MRRWIFDHSIVCVWQVEKEGLPRDQPVLHLLLRMLALGLSAWEMIDSQDFREPRLELPLIVQFVPSLMTLIVDDQVNFFYN